MLSELWHQRFPQSHITAILQPVKCRSNRTFIDRPGPQHAKAWPCTFTLVADRDAFIQRQSAHGAKRLVRMTHRTGARATPARPKCPAAGAARRKEQVQPAPQ